MKIIKTAGKKKLTISKKEWESIGKTAGWIKVAEEVTIEDIDRRIKNLQSSLSPVVDINADYGIGSWRDCQSEDDVDSYARERSLRRQIGELQKKRQRLLESQKGI